MTTINPSNKLNKLSSSFHIGWLQLSKRAIILSALLLLLILSIFIALSIGGVNVTIQDWLQGDISSRQQAVLQSIRLPRVLLSVVVGVGLAVAGAAMQGLFRNPLADPGLIGISSGAALTVAISIVLLPTPAGVFGLYQLSIAAFAGSLLTCFVIFRIARSSGTFSVTYLLLAGIAINALAGAGIGLMTYLSDDNQLRSLTFWSLGSFGGALWPTVIVTASIVLPAIAMLNRYARELNVLLLGEREAKHLGVDVDRLKFRIIVCTAFAVGASVAASGLIGFVGLVIPHLVRLTLGPDHRMLFPVSAILGAMLLLIADTIARTIVSPAEMPVGILTSIIGGPFFLWLLMKQFSNRFSL